MAEDYKERASRSRKEMQERGVFKLVVGENTIRILRTPEDEKRNSPSVFIHYRMHSDVGPEKRFLRCGKSIRGKGDCWLCDKLIPKLERTGRSAMAAKIAPKPMLEIQVGVVDKETGEMRGPLRFYLSAGASAKSLAYKLQGLISSSKKDYVNPKKGYNVTIQRTGTGRTDTVYELIGPDDEPTKVPKRIMESLRPFVDFIPKYDEERQKNAYYGREDNKEDDSDVKKKKRYDEDEDEDTKKKKKRSRDDDDEDEEEEEEEDEDDSDDDDDDDDEPKKKKKKKKSKDDDDDDDDDSDEDEDSDDDDDDEDDDKKKKKKKKKKDDDEDDDDDDDSDDDSDDDDDDEEEEDEDDDDEPKKKKKKKKKDDDDEDDDDEEEDEEEEDEDDDDDDDRKKKKKKKKKR